jgi:hypothetical protein
VADKFDVEVRGSISVFDEDYRYWRSQLKEDGTPYSHFEARNKAIDYYRQFTKREVNETDEFSLDTFESDQHSPDEIAELNLIFDKVFRNTREVKIKKLFCFLLRAEALEDLLNESNRDMVDLMIGDSNPGSAAEMSEAMGFKVNGNRVSNSLLEWKYALQNLLQDLDLFDKFDSKFAIV